MSNNDLISREALKNEFRVKFYIAKLFVYLAKYRILTPILYLYLKHNGFEV